LQESARDRLGAILHELEVDRNASQSR
jgi:hypothetical protein